MSIPWMWIDLGLCVTFFPCQFKIVDLPPELSISYTIQTSDLYVFKCIIYAPPWSSPINNNKKNDLPVHVVTFSHWHALSLKVHYIGLMLIFLTIFGSDLVTLH